MSFTEFKRRFNESLEISGVAKQIPVVKEMVNQGLERFTDVVGELKQLYNWCVVELGDSVDEFRENLPDSLSNIRGETSYLAGNLVGIVAKTYQLGAGTVIAVPIIVAEVLQMPWIEDATGKLCGEVLEKPYDKLDKLERKLKYGDR
jgi:hypothetical protein